MEQANSDALDPKKLLDSFFGQTAQQMEQIAKNKSIYKNFRSFKLAHVIIKTGDNLKQEQFALQLIQQFEYIFLQEKLDMKMTIYEVLSLDCSSGVMEKVTDCNTYDSIKKNMCMNYKQIESIEQLFRLMYKNDFYKAQYNFCVSLAGYSLICYILQIKDRHNGNILLKRDGSLFHIDFGFFLSNTPKGQLEKSVPFKFINEYSQLLGGPKGKMFNLFRKMFFQGFEAIRKHQDQLLYIIKMLYTGHGSSLPCFIQGEETIKALEGRINPPKVKSSSELNMHCQKLINTSIDNWRAKWYDKFQYYVQGIFY